MWLWYHPLLCMLYKILLWSFKVFNSYISLVGRFNVMLPSAASPYRKYPRIPMIMYSSTTIVIVMFSTPGQPRKCCGLAIVFSTGRTTPMPSIANITVLKQIIISVSFLFLLWKVYFPSSWCIGSARWAFEPLRAMFVVGEIYLFSKIKLSRNITNLKLCRYLQVSDVSTWSQEIRKGNKVAVGWLFKY